MGKPMLKGKGGFSLVEVICAVAVLAIISVGAILLVSFARTSVIGDGAKDRMSAQCQDTVDLLTTALSKYSGAELTPQQGIDLADAVTKAFSPTKYVPPAAWPPQNPDDIFYFTVESGKTAPEDGSVSYYNVRGILYWSDAGKSAELNATASCLGGTP